MIKRLLFILFISMTFNAFSADIYVDQSAPSGGDGISWATAFNTIQNAVDAAAANDVIFIAEGTYKPQNTINIGIPLAIKGGYPQGGGVQNIPAYIAQIEADFDSSNLLYRIFNINVNADTSIEGLRFYNVRSAIETKSSLTLDQVQFYGSTTSDISSNGSFNTIAIFNSLFSNCAGTSLSINSTTIDTVTLSNTIFQNGTNRAFSINDTVSNFFMTDCTLKNYSSTTTLGSSRSPYTAFTNITVINNSADIFSFTDNITDITNMVAVNNFESRIIYHSKSILNIYDSKFTDNYGAQSSCIRSSNSDLLNVENSIFTNNSSTGGGVAVLNSNRTNTSLSNSKFNNNYSEGSFNNAVMDITGNEDYDILINIDSCEFKDNISEGNAALEIEYYVDLILNNCLFENNGNNASEDLDLWYLDSALITNNTFLNNTSNEAVINIGYMYVNGAVIENNLFRNNNGKDINADRVQDYTSSNNHFYGDHILVEIDRSAAATLHNDYFEGNITNSEFILIDRSEVTISNSTFISKLPTGTHTVIDMNSDSSLNLLNTTISAANYEDTNVSVDFDNDLPSWVRNSIIWSGDNLAQSGFSGNTSNLTIDNSLIKGENPTGIGNLDGTVINNRPRFVNPTQLDFRALVCSPTVNAGDNSFNSETMDILNNPRVFDTTIDMGSYELQDFTSSVCNTPEVPLCTSLTLPINDATNVGINTDLSWAEVSDAVGYTLRVGTAPGTWDIFDQVLGSATHFNLANDLPADSQIYVEIVPYNGIGPAQSCTTYSFTTVSETTLLPTACTNLTAPIDGSITVAVDADISWNADPNAEGYRLSIGITSGGNDILLNFDVGNATTYDFPADYLENTTYFVTITPYNSLGNAMGCVEESFTTETILDTPECTILSSPLNGAIDVSTSTDISWDSVSNADGYLISLGTTSGSTDILIETDVTDSTFDLPSDLQEGTEIFVTIIPYNSAGNAIGCNEESFMTESLISVLECTQLVSPLENETNVSIDTAITWNAVVNATGYFLNVGTDSGVWDLLDSFDVGNTTTYDLPNDLPAGSEIFVLITPYDGINTSLSCNETSFGTESIPIVPNCTTLSLPLDGAIDVSITTDFFWNAAPNATGYRIHIADNFNFYGEFDVGNNLSYDLSFDLPENELIYVRLIPYNDAGDAIGGCTSESFTTGMIEDAPNCTSLISPLHLETNVLVTTDFTWNAVSNADGFLITVGTTSGGDEILIETDITNTTYNLPNDLPEGTEIFVTIIPYNSTGNAIGCVEERFITETILTIPECTTLTMPLEGETNVSVSTNFSWNAVDNVSGYLINIGDDDNFYGEYDAGNALTYDLPYDLPLENTLVHVRIIPYDADGNENHSCAYESFTTGTIPTIPECTALTFPLDGATDISLSTEITWEAVDNVTGYFISIGTSLGNADLLDNFDVGTSTTYLPTIDFTQGSTVYVLISPYNANGVAFGCAEDSFTFRNSYPPDCAYMTFPSPGAIEVPIDIAAISWNPPEPNTYSVTGYYLSIGLSPNGGEILDAVNVGNNTSYNLLDPLPENTEIYVTVVPFNNDGIATGCASESFNTETVTVIPQEDTTKYGFSPDGNGINDFWKIDGIQNYPNNEVMIYNRWGDLVFSIKGYDNNSKVFRGDANKNTKMGAGKLPSGTYFFNIHIDGNHHLKKTQGFVVLKR
ncbi:T9SS type B sorting domain-containing protein [Winogradskyella costae]|uniref:T9SS type B sorting domain-containing protein n=1 Tax=Winogradskyella costae TaxID=2697008 RepID=UPI0015CB482D|nr:gliding motility-associated C-terminal domain-containing protein [Winogradskyella costae]